MNSSLDKYIQTRPT